MNLMKLFPFILVLSCSHPSEKELLSRAKEIHKNVITLDTHVDINRKDFTKKKNYGSLLEKNQVDLPKMEEGGLDAVFFIVYVQQGKTNKKAYKKAKAEALKSFKAIRLMTEELIPNRIELAKTPADVRRIWKSGKKVAMIGMENGYPVGERLSNIKEFHNLGARYISITHNGHNQLGDSNIKRGKQPDWPHKGLSALGKKMVLESNKVGIMVDISHASMATAMDVMKTSKAPVIASHSGVKAVYDHSRNLSDEVLMALKKNGGVVQAVAFTSYLKAPSKEKMAEMNALNKEYGLPPGNIWQKGDKLFALVRAFPKKKSSEYWKKLNALDDKYKEVFVKELVDHIDYVVQKIGIDHVGISSDFGGGGGIHGWSNASETLNVTYELVKRGYTQEQIAKIWSGNLLRVWSAVEATAKKLN